MRWQGLEALLRSLGFVPSTVGTSGVVTCDMLFFSQKTFVAAMWRMGWGRVRVAAQRTVGLVILYANPGKKMVPWPRWIWENPKK